MTNANAAAVTFCWASFRCWKDFQPEGEGTPSNQEKSELLSAAYQRLDGEAGWILETTLSALHEPVPADKLMPAWQYFPGVSDCRVWSTAAAEGGPDGGVVGEVTVDGVRLSLGRLTVDDLITSEDAVMPGWEAAELALFNLAERVNEVAAAFRGRHDDEDDDVVDAEVVEDDKPQHPADGRGYSAYDQAAAAVDNDPNHPAHPMHW
jgi:hypothetical protein